MNKFSTALSAIALSTAPLVSDAQSLPAGDLDLTFFGGINESPNSDFSVTNSAGQSTDYTIGWEGKSFNNPIYYSFRLGYTPHDTPDIRYSLEFIHAKVYGILEGDIVNDFIRLEFTDGNNLLIGNVDKSWTVSDKVNAYVGAGLGLSIPHVEVTTTNNSIVGEQETFGYQLAGGAAQIFAGVTYDFNDKVSGVLELASSWSHIEPRLQNGATMNVNVIRHDQVKFGIQYNF